ncbi:MAG: serine/threonine protein kinase [Verrucomicrobia bacterium]|nr:serine/threonine protein kinase [Verrucomicrobiota bacterium]
MVTCGKCKAKRFLPAGGDPLTPVPCPSCGHPVIIPVQIRQFELREVIGSGGMGTVFRAFDVTLERFVAVKFLKREMAQDTQVLESFHREARAGAALNHTNIIHIYTFDEYNGQPYLVMELADNGSLDSRIEQDGAVSELAVLDVGIKMTSALQSALQLEMLHRDIKPGNILYNAAGEPKLVDFGLARKAQEEEEYGSSVWGTPYYVAPEKIERKKEDFHSDMYSLGGTLYHALTGHVPFEADTIEQVVAGHVHTPLTPPHEVVPHITQPTSDAICTAMAKNPDDRYPTYDDFHMALEAARSYLLVDQMKQHQALNPQAHPHLHPHAKSWWKR